MCTSARLSYFENLPSLLFLLSYEGAHLAYRASKLLTVRYRSVAHLRYQIYTDFPSVAIMDQVNRLSLDNLRTAFVVRLFIMLCIVKT